MWTWIKKIGIIVLLFWNIALVVTTLLLYSRLTTTQNRLDIIVANQQDVAKILHSIVMSQENIVNTCDKNLTTYYRIKTTYDHMYINTSAIQSAEKAYRSCVNESKNKDR